jgi:hypothetical protein
MDILAILYPSLLVCAFFGLILLVGIGFSYLWLRMLDRRMRKCPRCQKVGAGAVTESTVIASKNYMDFQRQPPARVAVKTYEDHYECQYCGHKWTKTAEETTRTTVKL